MAVTILQQRDAAMIWVCEHCLRMNRDQVDACATILGDDTLPWPNKRWLNQDGSFSFDDILGRVKP